MVKYLLVAVGVSALLYGSIAVAEQGSSPHPSSPGAAATAAKPAPAATTTALPPVAHPTEPTCGTQAHQGPSRPAPTPVPTSTPAPASTGAGARSAPSPGRR